MLAQFIVLLDDGLMGMRFEGSLDLTAPVWRIELKALLV